MSTLSKFAFLISFFQFVGQLRAQDYQQSQFDALPLNLNPALIGDRTDEKYLGVRLTSGYRDQRSNYTSSADSYKSFLVGLDFSVGERFSTGAFFSNTKSPNNVFNVSNFNYGVSYKMIGSNARSQEKHELAIGMQLGLLNNSFSTGNFTYDLQYSSNAPDGFDQTLPSGENFQSSVKVQFSGNSGINYKANLYENKLIINAGASIYNITKSTERFNGVYLPAPLRYNGHFSALYRLDERFTLAPQTLYMYQTGAHELNIGTLIYYHMNEQSKVILGANWRKNNAVILQTGLSVSGVTFRLSYCVGTGYLSTFKNRAVEFSLSYINGKKTFVPRVIN
jgi:type IX secretion system PorP/SprF family membrane protein